MQSVAHINDGMRGRVVEREDKQTFAEKINDKMITALLVYMV